MAEILEGDALLASLQDYCVGTLLAESRPGLDVEFSSADLDSLDLIELVMEAEVLSGKKVDNATLGEISTLRQLVGRLA